MTAYMGVSVFKRILFLLITATALFGKVIASGQAPSTPIATLEPENIASLFHGDTCEPPCWFGLIPGESTEEAVLDFLEAHNDEIMFLSVSDHVDFQTGKQIGNRYHFGWRDYSYFNPPRVLLTIENGVLSYIWANPNREITFGEMIDVLGYPDQLYLGTVGWSLLTAIYEKPRVRILLDSRSPSSLCKIHDIAREFRVMEMQYFSMEAAQELVTPTFSPNATEPEPRLLLRGKNNYLVSEEQLEEWLGGHGDATCSEVWYQLRAENEES